MEDHSDDDGVCNKKSDISCFVWVGATTVLFTAIGWPHTRFGEQVELLFQDKASKISRTCIRKGIRFVSLAPVCTQLPRKLLLQTEA